MRAVERSCEGASTRCASGFRFFDGEDLIGGYVGEGLHGAAWPGYANFFDGRVRAETEMNAGIAGACVAYCRGGLVPLQAAVRSCDANLRAETHAIAARALEANEYPVLAGGADVSEKLDRLV